ncbi:MAG: GNAT family N-acetyltransferase [Lachnospiraceae bacterium]|nr:GNAT family N-acetyltransferase [Lachnospiraceae bacterium]
MKRVMGNCLQCVLFDLGAAWEQEKSDFRKSLVQEGIFCARLSETDIPLVKKNSGTVILTDSPKTGAKLAREGIVYFGCCHSMNARIDQKSAAEATDADTVSCWFDGAALVLESFEEVDARFLEEWMLRAKGQPVMIASTGRLMLREMSDEDIPELERIGRECAEKEAYEEIRYAGENICEEKELHVHGNRFTKEYLYSYRRTAYRLQGFGLWSVLYQDRVIGCCGFEPWDERLGTAESAAPRIVPGKRKVDTIQSPEGMLPDRTDISTEQTLAWTDNIILYHLSFRETFNVASGSILEMQYMLEAAYHQQGLGMEMCRAALAYAKERLEADEVRLRIREDNLASRALAEKLGFVSEL